MHAASIGKEGEPRICRAGLGLGSTSPSPAFMNTATGGVGVVVGRPGLAWAAPTYSSNTLYRGSVYVVYICFQNARSNQVVRSTCVCRYRFPNGSSQIVAVILDERSSPFVSKA